MVRKVKKKSKSKTKGKKKAEVWVLIEEAPFLDEKFVHVFKTKDGAIQKAKKILLENAEDHREYSKLDLERDLRELKTTDSVIQFDDEDDMVVLTIKKRTVK